MKYLLYSLVILLASCQGEKTYGTLFDLHIDIIVENSAGENLLADTTSNAINPESLRLEYRINGVNRPVYDPSQACPRNICYLADYGQEFLRIFPNDAESEAYPKTYLIWSTTDVDTIMCHFIRENDNNFIVCDTVWYNEVLMFLDTGSLSCLRRLKIVK